MSRLGRILGRRGRRAADDHDPTTTVDPTAARPAADPGERAAGLWESGAHHERADDDASASAIAPGTDPATGSGGDTVAGAPQRDGGDPARAWHSSPVADGGDPSVAASPSRPAEAGSHAIGTAGTGGNAPVVEPATHAGEPVAPVAGTEATVAGSAALAAGGDADASPAGLTIRPRSRMRRRLRYLRRARELQLRDLGGFVYEQARTAGGDHGRQENLLNEKVRRVRAIDEEIGALAATLGAPARRLAIREPGVGGNCPTCGELHPSDARYCSNCGTRVDVRGASGGAQGSVLAAWTNPESPPAPAPATPAPVAWGEAAPSDASAGVPASGRAEPVEAAADVGSPAGAAAPYAPVDSRRSGQQEPAAVVAQPAGAAGDVTPPPQDAPMQDVGAADEEARSLRSLDAPSGAEGHDVAAVPASGHDPAPPSAARGMGDAVAPAGRVEAVDAGHPIDPRGSRDPIDPADPRDPIDPADPADPRDPIDPADPADPRDPIDPADPRDPIDPADPRDPIDPADPRDPIDPADPRDPVDPADPAAGEPVGSRDAAPPVDPVDHEAPTRIQPIVTNHQEPR